MLHVHLNQNQLQPQLLIWQQKTVRGLLDSNFANFHSTTQDKFMRNASSKRDATCHDTHTHTHTWGTPHTIYLPQVASYVPNKRSCHCSGLPRPHSHLPHTPHFATVYRVQKNELSLSKSWNLIRKKDYTILVEPSFSRRSSAAAAKWNWLAASNANNCELLQQATPSHQLATAHTHTHTESSPKLFYVNINTKQKQKRRQHKEKAKGKMKEKQQRNGRRKRKLLQLQRVK